MPTSTEERDMRNHKTALGIIESRFLALDAGNDSLHLHAEAEMAVEMAYALGAIDCTEHREYKRRQMELHARSHARTMENMRRFDRVPTHRKIVG